MTCIPITPSLVRRAWLTVRPPDRYAPAERVLALGPAWGATVVFIIHSPDLGTTQDGSPAVVGRYYMLDREGRPDTLLRDDRLWEGTFDLREYRFLPCPEGVR